MYSKSKAKQKMSFVYEKNEGYTLGDCIEDQKRIRDP